MDYENPFGAINPQSFAGNPGGPGFVNQWETGVATEKAEMAKPFIEMMKQRDEMDLAKKRMEFGEFGSPEAIRARKEKMLLEGETAAASRQKIAPELARDIEKAKQELRTMGPEADAKIAQAEQIARDIKDKPIQKFFASAADYGGILNQSKADPLTKAADYKQWIENFKTQNPDVKIPPNLENWSANTGRYLAQARLVALHSVEFEQKSELEDKKLRSEEKRTAMSSGATVQAAQITATQSGENAKLVAGSREDQVRKGMADHITAAETKAMDSLGYIQAPDKDAFLDKVKERAKKNYMDIIGGKKDGANPSEDSLKDAVVKSGYEFEPDKYDYRIGPNGIAQRKPKGK